MSGSNPVSKALENVALHAKHYALAARGRGDERSVFIYSELANMLGSLSDLKRSPMLDALNDRVATKARDGYFQDARLVAVALVTLLMRNGLSRRHACQMAAGATGLSMNTIEKKCSIPSDVLELPVFLADNPDVSRIVADHALIAGSDIDENIIAALEETGGRIGAHVEAEDWRLRQLAKAFSSRVDNDANLSLLMECSDDALNALVPQKVEP